MRFNDSQEWEKLGLCPSWKIAPPGFRRKRNSLNSSVWLLCFHQSGNQLSKFILSVTFRSLPRKKENIPRIHVIIGKVENRKLRVDWRIANSVVFPGPGPGAVQQSCTLTAVSRASNLLQPTYTSPAEEILTTVPGYDSPTVCHHREGLFLHLARADSPSPS